MTTVIKNVVRANLMALLAPVVLIAMKLTINPCYGAFEVVSSRGVRATTGANYHYYHRSKHHSVFVPRKPAAQGSLSLSSSGENEKNSGKESATISTKQARLGRKDGVYVRPSAAIERGSGFFVPGLEGPKVKVVVASVLLIATALNHALSPSPESVNSFLQSSSFLESVAAAYSILLLAQAAVEFRISTRLEESPSRIVSSHGSVTSTFPAKLYHQQWLIPVNDQKTTTDWKESVEWAAKSYLSLTPATHMALLGPGSIVYWLGESSAPIDNTGDNDDSMSKGCQAALDTCLKSKTGRVALPPSHPTVLALQPSLSSSSSSSSQQQPKDSITNEKNEEQQQGQQPQRCFVLQKVDETSQLCWMMTSNQLLESFSKRDLQWLGQVALYVQQALPQS
ncbi:hypothetical protein ACA910_022325 [Epithemia clementina (nom. ined.)]